MVWPVREAIMSGPGFERETSHGIPLERRAGRRARRAPPPPSARPTLLVSASAFKQTLMKYIRRQARYGRTFCLASIEILEYEQVKNTLGAHAAQQLHRLGQDVCLKYLRDADRLCGAQPGQFLLLLPDTDPQGARQALERLAQLMGTAKAHYHHKQLRASASFHIVDSAQQGSDPEVLLGELGFKIDEGGNLGRHLGPDRAYRGAMAQAPFCGDFDVWSERYADIKLEGEGLYGENLRVSRLSARDCWRGGKPVQMRLIEPDQPDTSLEADFLDLIARRARVLQSIDHPGLLSTADYHLQDRRKLCLVQDRLDGPILGDYLLVEEIDGLTLLDWALQILGSIIYLQGLMPPLVPPPPGDSSFIVGSGKHLVLVEFEIPYLFPNWHQPSQISAEEILAVAQGRPVAAYAPVLTGLARLMSELISRLPHPPGELAALLSCLQTEELPAEWNTVFKLRSAVKRIWDKERVNLAYRP